MNASDYKKFSSLHEAGALLPPTAPGGAIAGLAISADHSLSGQFISWDDAQVAKHRLD